MKDRLCVACGNKKLKFLYVLYSSTFGNVEKKFSIVKCKKCGLIFIKNAPTEKELEEMYSSDYFDMTEHEMDISKFENRVTNWEIKRYNKILKGIERNCKRGNLLEIGPGLGSFLVVARKKGWSVEGMEPSKMMAKYCREKLKINVNENFLEKAKYKEGTFSVVYMDNVFEHVLDPVKTLLIIKKWLKKDGLIVIEVPNEGGLLYTAVRVYKRIRQLFGIKNDEKLLQHMFYYDIKSMKQLMNKAGYEVVEVSTRDTSTTKGLNHILSMIQRLLLAISKYSRNKGDILTVFARRR